jgi:hypothetical protein
MNLQNQCESCSSELGWDWNGIFKCPEFRITGLEMNVIARVNSIGVGTYTSDDVSKDTLSVSASPKKSTVWPSKMKAFLHNTDLNPKSPAQQCAVFYPAI